jgi:hypothetical protein
MAAKLAILVLLAGILGALLVVVRNNGKQAERLRALRESAIREAKERAKANETVDNVRNMSNDDVRTRLRRVSEGHNRNDLQ